MLAGQFSDKPNHGLVNSQTGLSYKVDSKMIDLIVS